ncbi:hypothetical protein PR202_gb15089 [Eleusine coracana subsp. coracana]|uniref:At1g61320/AtMIF1 LRR domain-containing protein n=1 Tax=Eleusine coracana subsp. coracana TaxID=191504 RepID=A0AAV5EUR8_ELECO|nr:hypothetical protein PR202_gb15089 [Eleusine coracana subsp. coracana]
MPSIKFEDLPQDVLYRIVSKLSSKEFARTRYTGYHLWLAEVGPRRQDVGQCKYCYLKNIHISGFKAAREQVEFLLHIVENAPALEVLTINTTQESSREFWPYKGSPPFDEAKRIAITSLTVAPPQNVKFYVI